MGSTFGRQPLTGLGESVHVSSDGVPYVKSGGVTIDWSTVAVVNSGADTTWNESFLVPAGEKALRYGQILTRITAQPAQTITVGGTPTGGTFTAVGTNPLNNVQTSQTIAYNASVATIQAAMDAIFGAGNTLVSGAGALPGNVLTVTFQGALIDYAPVLLTGSPALLTGGTPTLTYAIVVAGGNYGDYGPFDPAASDGRQTLARGSCWILNESVAELGSAHSNHPPVIDGGRCFKARILQSGVAGHSLALGPTLAEFEAAFPSVRYTGV